MLEEHTCSECKVSEASAGGRRGRYYRGSRCGRLRLCGGSRQQRVQVIALEAAQEQAAQ